MAAFIPDLTGLIPNDTLSASWLQTRHYLRKPTRFFIFYSLQRSIIFFFLFLGQVKCYLDDVAFNPIAIIHSNMIKKGAKGGYLITTSSFTPAARQYAEGLDIDLIDGIKLVELWLSGLVNVEQEIKKLLPEYV